MSDSAVSATHATKQHAGIPVTVNLVVPTGKAALRRALGERNPFFVALGTKGAKVVAFAHGDRTTPLGSVVANVAANSTVCTSGAARVCALALSVQAAGKDDFVITTYDQSPAGNVIPATAKQLGAGVDVKKIGKNGKTIVAVVGGVVSSTSLFLSQGAVSSIDATKFSAIVVPRDADGNAIVTDSYRKRDGNESQNHPRLERQPVISIQPEQLLIRSQRARRNRKLQAFRRHGRPGAERLLDRANGDRQQWGNGRRCNVRGIGASRHRVRYADRR